MLTIKKKKNFQRIYPFREFRTLKKMFEAGNVFMEGFLNSNILFYIQHISLECI